MKDNKIQWRAWTMAFGLTLFLIWGCGGEEKQQGGIGTEVDVVESDSAGDSASVEDRIRRVTEKLSFSKKNWKLYNERSQLWYESGNIPRAMADIDRAIDYHVVGPENYYLKGFYFYALKRDSAAIVNLEKAAQLGSEDPENYYLLGQLRFLEEEYDEANKAYNTAISLDSMVPTYHFAKGYMAQSRNRIDDAIEQYRQALKRDPTFIKALLALHDIYLNIKKDPDQAYAFNERVIAVDSTQPVARYNQGNFFMARANLLTSEQDFIEFSVLVKIAIAEYTRCIEGDPNFVQAYYNRGYSHFLLDKYSPALQDFSTVIELDPYNEKAFFMKASIQEGQGDLVSALENYRQAVRLDPKFRDAERAVKELTVKVKDSSSENGNENS